MIDELTVETEEQLESLEENEEGRAWAYVGQNSLLTTLLGYLQNQTLNIISRLKSRENYGK